MNPLTIEWVQKAEGDWASAAREMRARKARNFDSVCFHAQQCAEKYLKACLQEAGVYFERTHNLVKLLDQLLPTVPDWAQLRQALHELSAHAVDVRYPGVYADAEMARSAVKTAGLLRELGREHLGCPADAKSPRRKKRAAQSKRTTKARKKRK